MDYDPVSYVHPLAKEKKLNVEFEYSPSTLRKWHRVRSAETLLIFFVPTISIVLMAYYFNIGNHPIPYIRTDVETLTIIGGLSNLLLLPITILNYRCPHCGLYVHGNRNPFKPTRFYHYLPNLFVRRCPSCHTQLRPGLPTQQ